MLRNLRRVAVAACSPASGRGGEQIDLALMVADGGPRGSADPAFAAHLLPIGEWAAAVGCGGVEVWWWMLWVVRGDGVVIISHWK